MAEAKTTPAEKSNQRSVFYGYACYSDANGRFLGEEVAGSNSFYVFSSKEVFENAVSAYNVIGNPPVKSAASGKA